MLKKMNTKFVGHHVSSGGFIFHFDKSIDEIFVLLVKNKKDEYWIPKGHIEEGEEQLVAAFREIKEEVGLNNDQLEYIGLCNVYEFSFTDSNGKLNTKSIFMNVFNSFEKYNILPEKGDTDIIDAEWLTYDVALDKILPFSKKELTDAKNMFCNYCSING